MDNARALVLHHDPASGSGKDERGVRYVKESGLAGREFPSWQAMEAHLEGWNRQVADQRRHGTTGESPLLRFEREEAAALLTPNRPSFLAEWEGQLIVATNWLLPLSS